MAPVTRKRRAKQEEDAASEAQSSPAAGSLKGKRDEGTDTQAGGKGNLTVFGDDDSAPILPKPASKPSEKRKMEQQPEEEDSDDDAAPEAVSTQKVASDLKKSAQEAQHAAQEQAAEQKRKRQQRDTLFKQQADERRKLEEAKKEASQPRQPTDSSHGGRKRADRAQAPNLLPAEFLTDSSSEDSDDDEEDRKNNPSRIKRRKVSTAEKGLSRLDRAPRDEKLGNTVYRVAKKVDERMVPKVKKNSMNAKEKLMARGRQPVKSGGGFFKKR